MKDSVKTQIEAAKLKVELRELAKVTIGQETTEQAKALAEKLNALDLRYIGELDREAKEEERIAEMEPDPETRELKKLKTSVMLAAYVIAAHKQTPLEGREKELNQALKLSADGTSVPWEALEQRADVPTVVAANADIDRNTRPILSRIFKESDSAFLGVSFQQVPVGEQNFPVLTGGTAGRHYAPGAEAQAGAATFRFEQLAPTRLSARYVLRIEDMARLAGLEQAIRADLTAVIQTEIDDTVINGSGANNEPKGFLQDADVAANSDLSARTATKILAQLAGGIDGIAARTLEDIRWLVEVELYQRMVATPVVFAGGLTESGLLTALLGRSTGGIRGTGHIKNAAANRGDGILYKTRQPGAYPAVAAMWPSLELIRDPYTGAAKGEVAFTAIVLWNFLIVRGGAWQHTTTNTAE